MSPIAATSRKLPARTAQVLTPLLISILMSAIVSFIATLKGFGPHPGLLQAWLPAWGLSWVVAFPALLVIIPLVRRVVTLVVALPGQGR